MTIITIEGVISTREVTLNGDRLDPSESQAVINHSPDGFNWGYGGSGPAQLALAILIEVMGQERALMEYQNFKDEHVAKWIQEDFFVEIEVDGCVMCQGTGKVVVEEVDDLHEVNCPECMNGQNAYIEGER